MGLINFKDIDFNKSINKENKIIEFNGSEIQIVNYLSIHDKYDLIMITLQKAFEEGIYNDIKLHMYFNLNIIYMYTNIIFNSEDRADEESLYDTLERSGLILAVKEQIDNNELNFLWDNLKKIEVKIKEYKGNLLHFLTDAIANLPGKAEKALETLKQIDPELLKSLAAGPFSTIFNGMMSNVASDLEATE
jgi:hypothetical protein